LRTTCSGVWRCPFMVPVLLAHILGSRTLTTGGPVFGDHVNALMLTAMLEPSSPSWSAG
jgi:hypothetical protein